jgi:hypothetical protein
MNHISWLYSGNSLILIILVQTIVVSVPLLALQNSARDKFKKIIFLHYPMRGEYMATMAIEPVAIEPKIKAAMESIGNIGLGERANDILDMLDEMAMEAALKESEEQFKRGETTTIEEMKKRTTERLNNGYYLK